jgi:hypothetical protein
MTRWKSRLFCVAKRADNAASMGQGRHASVPAFFVRTVRSDEPVVRNKE